MPHPDLHRVTGVDGMTLGYAKPFAEVIESPVFLGWGDVDVSAEPHVEPSAYPRSRHVTLSVVDQMAHMHNFADTVSFSGRTSSPGSPLQHAYTHAP